MTKIILGALLSLILSFPAQSAVIEISGDVTFDSTDTAEDFGVLTGLDSTFQSFLVFDDTIVTADAKSTETFPPFINAERATYDIYAWHFTMGNQSWVIEPMVEANFHNAELNVINNLGDNTGKITDSINSLAARISSLSPLSWVSMDFEGESNTNLYDINDMDSSNINSLLTASSLYLYFTFYDIPTSSGMGSGYTSNLYTAVGPAEYDIPEVLPEPDNLLLFGLGLTGLGFVARRKRHA